MDKQEQRYQIALAVMEVAKKLRREGIWMLDIYVDDIPIGRVLAVGEE